MNKLILLVGAIAAGIAGIFCTCMAFVYLAGGAGIGYSAIKLSPIGVLFGMVPFCGFVIAGGVFMLLAIGLCLIALTGDLYPISRLNKDGER